MPGSVLSTWPILTHLTLTSTQRDSCYSYHHTAYTETEVQSRKKLSNLPLEGWSWDLNSDPSLCSQLLYYLLPLSLSPLSRFPTLRINFHSLSFTSYGSLSSQFGAPVQLFVHLFVFFPHPKPDENTLLLPASLCCSFTLALALSSPPLTPRYIRTRSWCCDNGLTGAK